MRHMPYGLISILTLVHSTVLLTYSDSAVASPASIGRVDVVDYDAKQVVPIQALVGFAVHVALQPTERIESVAIGDAEHWAVQARDGAHDVFLKPRAGAQSTNLAIRTDLRSYSLSLAVIRSGVPTFRIEFRYPSIVSTAPLPKIDRHYSMQVGMDSKRIAPEKAFDDEHFTYLAFPPHAEFPAVFEVLDDGSERLVNHHTENGILVIHLVTHELVLRLGPAVVNVFRDDALPTSKPAPERPVERLERLDRNSDSP